MELKQIQEDIDLHREEYLDRIRKKCAEEENKELATVVMEMKHREKQKRAWQKK